MKKFTLILLLALSSLLITLKGAFPEERKYDEGWYDVVLNEEKIGYEHHIFSRTSYKGQKCFKIEETSLGKISINGKTSTVESESTSFIREDMKPLFEKTVVREKDQLSVSEIEVTDDEVTFRKKLGNSTTTSSIPLQPDYTFGVSPPMLVLKGLKVGNAYTLKVLSDDKCSVERETVEITGREKLALHDRPVDCYRIKVTSSMLPGIPIYLWVDDHGRILKTQTLSVVTLRVGKERAQTIDQVSTYSNRILTGQLIPDTDRITDMRIAVSIGKSQLRDSFENAPYQKVRVVGDRISLDLKSHAPEIEHPLLLPVREKQESLKPSVYIQSDSPLIREKSREILGGERDSLVAVRLLCKWVYQNIKKQESTVSMQSAEETLNNRTGDCTEHAVLFCALARAAGIPCRQVTGLVFIGDSFGFHAWAEAYCGVWVPVDATVSRVGTPAGYIFLGYDEEGKPTVSIMMKLVRMLKNTAIDIISVTMDGMEYDLQKPSTFIRNSAHTCVHSLWNASLEKPAGWGFEHCGPEKVILSDGKGSTIHFFPIFTAIPGNAHFMHDEICRMIDLNDDMIAYDAPEPGRMGEFHTLSQTFTYNKNSAAMKARAVAMLKSRKAFLLVMTAPEETYTEKNTEFETLIKTVTF